MKYERPFSAEFGEVRDAKGAVLISMGESQDDCDHARTVAALLNEGCTRPKETDIPDRETFWLVERNISPPQYVSLNSAGWHHDVWQARRFNSEREAHDYWRTMGEINRPQFKVVEHMFINKP